MPLIVGPDPAHVIYIVLTVLAGAMFYGLRCRSRFWYGVLEVVTSIVVIFVSWVPQKSYLLAHQGTGFLNSEIGTIIGIVGGIYILVRGLDNIGSDLPVRWQVLWDQIFRGHW
jgi:hypothetical protein